MLLFAKAMTFQFVDENKRHITISYYFDWIFQITFHSQKSMKYPTRHNYHFRILMLRTDHSIQSSTSREIHFFLNRHYYKHTVNAIKSVL